MKRRILMTICMFLLILSLLVVSVSSAFAAPPDDRPGKDPANFDKLVFIHYPKEIPAKGGTPGPPDGKGGGDKGDKEDGGKAWYKYSGIHWEDSALPVLFKLSTSNSDWLEAINDSFQTWEDDPDSYIDFEYAGGFSGTPSSFIGDGFMNGDNEVGWASISESYPNAIAVTLIWYNIFTGLIAEVDMAMNGDFPWSQTDIPAGTDPNIVIGDSSSYDVQNIVTHEVGHWLLLEDLYQKPAGYQTMFGYGSKGELKKRSLESGDLAGLQAIYLGPTAP